MRNREYVSPGTKATVAEYASGSMLNRFSPATTGIEPFANTCTTELLELIAEDPSLAAPLEGAPTYLAASLWRSNAPGMKVAKSSYFSRISSITFWRMQRLT